MIYVQHLLGIGHLQRSVHLANALASDGFRVELVSGGMPQILQLVPGVRLSQLPPLKSPDSSFSRLVDESGRDITPQRKQQRQQQLLDIFFRAAPQILITETFPFGRRMMRFELLPLLEAAQLERDCMVISSIRDILQPKSREERNREICELIGQYYDHVLVHADEKIVRLADSFELADQIESKVTYSGYISNPAAVSGSVPRIDEVLVSAGGSATGLKLLQIAIEARPLSRFSGIPWRILVSPQIAESDMQALQSQAENGVIVERNRIDFLQLLNRARLSVSQAGYNTITDILGSDTKAVVVPFAEAGEVEQTRRARLLDQHKRLVMLEEERLTPISLADAIERACHLTSMLPMNLQGAHNSALLLRQWLTLHQQNL